MNIEKLIHCLQCCARVDAHNIGCDDCGLEYCGPECQQLCGTAATALSTLQAENEKLRAELERVTAERDAAIKELNGVSSLVDDLAEFVDCEIHPVVDYNLYLDLRENVDAVSMFQHEDEWRGLHKEE